MGALSLMIFIGLYAFGERFIGFDSDDGKVQVALFLSFILGIVCGYRTGR
jgi:hypothetical protein